MKFPLKLWPPNGQFLPGIFVAWDGIHVLYFWKALGTGMLEMMFPGVNSPTYKQVVDLIPLGKFTYGRCVSSEVH